MTSALTKMVAKKLMGEQMKKYQKKEVGGPTDPYFTQVVNPRTGKVKKMKKQVPDYIPEHDAIILAKMRNRSYKLDMALFDFAGIRFGWSSVLGIIPAFGDAADAAMALLLVWRCSKIECGLGPVTIVEMLVNVLIDFVIGLVPILGDIADAAFKANTRNVRALEKRLDEAYKPKGLRNKDKETQKKVKEERRKSGLPYEEHYEAPPATVLEDFSDDESAPLTSATRPQTTTTAQHVPAAGVAQPQTAAKKNGRWFSSARGAIAQPDVERGVVTTASV